MNTLSLEHEGKVAVITLNRPERLNAINSMMVGELVDTLHEINSNDDTRAVILTGAGEKSFCVGMDLKERLTMSDTELATQRQQAMEMFKSIRECTRPLIAAVNGYALGGGLEIALACDFIISSAEATFGLPEVTKGIMPGGGGTQLLPQRIGIARASEMIFTGDSINAEKANTIGLVNRVVSSDELMVVTRGIARTIADNAPIGVRQSKKAMHFSQSTEEGIEFENEAYQQVLYSTDRQEGFRAFNEKRSPRFQGK